ncbi:helix-turn-helix domain-containing protein [bacterium]|jgi:DNA-binding transcriptional MerR regulator|nr:helix-turn-helix domain-containing protein [Algibacter sp.]MDA7809730.1 helix-turn-helix domain-containing protein [bacterium]MDB4273871.1 helix-turn-helix domain-containing protein [Algibacter sp.]|tara:strand:- start:1146 stop:1382 length:237 start_codon:yes stop_codon:yes gene_type:complete
MTGKYVPIEDVAKHFSVSISTIRAWVRQQDIPQDTYIKVGSTYRFCIDDVAEALTRAEKKKEKPVLMEAGAINFDDDI